jgi:predicted ATPase
MKISSEGKGRFTKPFSIEFNNKIEIVVGDNGSGKSSLLSALRGTFVEPSYDKGSLYNFSNKELSESITVEHDFDKAFFYDAVKDKPNDLNNAYDAMEFIRNGGFETRDKSHGQSSLYLISKMIDEIETYRKANPTAKILVILDEPEVGFDLKTQFKLPKMIANISNFLDCHIILATHNYMLVNNNEEVTVADNMTYKRMNTEKYVDSLVGKS